MLLPKSTSLILAQLRTLFLNFAIVGDQELSALIVPSWDPHHNIRVAECYQRRAFISGFDGGAGTAIVTQSEALLFTDARYFLQAQQQLDENWELMRDGLPETPTQSEWIQRNLLPGSRIGVDATTLSKSEWTELSTALESFNQTLVPVNQNLVDLIWDERPSCPRNEIKHLPIEFSGKNTSQKLTDIRQQMPKDVGIIVISELDEVAWLLNLRGSDLPLAPTFFSFAFILRDHLHLFVDADRLSVEIQNELEIQTERNITYHNYSDVDYQLELTANNTEGKVWLSKNCNFALANSVTPEERQIVQLTPLALMKAIKNPTEVDGMRKALIRDAASLCQFYSWLEDAMFSNFPVNEISAATKALEFRQVQQNFVSLSFKTISASGPNGAIIHYFPTEDTNRLLSKDEMYLVDSGAHYLDGTTDISRTFHFGEPTNKQKEFYTRVLKGQISVATLKFPNKTRGHMIDSFAREFLWSIGLDYGHGTGHGIGSYLNVGEGPQSINKYNPDDPGFVENMFTSNEPGCYVEDEFGIRLENIVRVVNSNFTHSDFLTFEDLTLVPYQQNLIKVELLTNAEISYLNNYQVKCREIVGRYILDNDLGMDGYDWLFRHTEPLPVHT